MNYLKHLAVGQEVARERVGDEEGGDPEGGAFHAAVQRSPR